MTVKKPPCLHPRGRYTPECPVCEGKKLRAQQRRKLRSGDPAAVQRITTQDIRDIQEVQQRLQVTSESIKIRIDALRVTRADPDHISTLASVLDTLNRSLVSLDLILKRHEAVIDSLGVPKARRYRHRLKR